MFAEGARADWLNTIAAQIMDGGSSPPSIDRLNITVPPRIMTRVSDGHCTAAAAFGEDRRKDKEAGWTVIISEMVTVLREQGFVGGSDQGLTWIKPVDGQWQVEIPGARITVFGQRERRMDRDRAIVGVRDEETGKPVGPPSVFESGKGAPLELLVESSRGNVKPQKFEIHRLASLMPSYTETERESLRDSIEKDGVKVPIVIYQKKILDGRNRSYFSTVFKKPVRITEFTGTEEEARRLVITLNVVRRHLTSAQQQKLANELFGVEAKKEAAEAKKQKDRLPRKTRNKRVENLDAPNEQDDGERWPDIAARKAREVGLSLATADGVRAMELVKDAPDTSAKIDSQEIKNASAAAAAARVEKGLPKAKTFEGASARSITKHYGEVLYHLNAMLTDFEMPIGKTPEKISERIRETRRLNDEVEHALRERKIIP